VDIDAHVAKLHTNEEMVRIAIECCLHFAFETSDVETREWNDGSCPCETRACCIKTRSADAVLLMIHLCIMRDEPPTPEDGRRYGAFRGNVGFFAILIQFAPRWVGVTGIPNGRYPSGFQPKVTGCV
jgi:hypothetical protein